MNCHTVQPLCGASFIFILIFTLPSAVCASLLSLTPFAADKEEESHLSVLIDLY